MRTKLPHAHAPLIEFYKQRILSLTFLASSTKTTNSQLKHNLSPSIQCHTPSSNYQEESTGTATDSDADESELDVPTTQRLSESDGVDFGKVITKNAAAAESDGVEQRNTYLSFFTALSFTTLFFFFSDVFGLLF